MTDNVRNTLSPSDIAKLINEYILTRLLPGEDAANLTDSTPLLSGGVIDSLSTMELGAFLEETFDIAIAPEELADPAHLETIASLASFVATKRAVTS